MQDNKNWNEQKEFKGGYYGLKIMLFIYNFGGRYIFSFVLLIVMFFYYLVAKKQRQYSREFLDAVNTTREKRGLNKLKLSTFAHFMSFGNMLIEKLRSWQGKLILGKDIVFKGDCEKAITKYNDNGRLLICSHFGDVEALRAIFTINSTYIINSIFYTDNAKNYNRFLKTLSPTSNINIITTTSMGPDTAVLLKEKIDDRQIVAIAADRIPTTYNSNHNNRTCSVEFLGRKAKFPQGPFILASILKCPVILVFGLKNPVTKIIDIVCIDFGEKLILDRRDKEASLQKHIQRYAKELEDLVIEYPYQWFNFFDFFKE